MSIEDINNQTLNAARELDQKNKKRITELAKGLIEEPLQPKTEANQPGEETLPTAQPQNQEEP